MRAAESFTDLAKIWGTSNQVAPAAAAVVSVVCRKERRFKFIIKEVDRQKNEATPPHWQDQLRRGDCCLAWEDARRLGLGYEETPLIDYDCGVGWVREEGRWETAK